MWCIITFTPDNGPPRVIPGSHRVRKPPTDVLAFGSGMGPHPDEVKIVAPAGSVIMFNSADLWHSGTLNYSPAPRLAVTAGFGPGSPYARSPAASNEDDQLLRRSLAGAWRAGPSQLGWRAGLAGSDREFPGLLPDRARAYLGECLPALVEPVGEDRGPSGEQEQQVAEAGQHDQREAALGFALAVLGQ
jgi:hypothetical protein